MSSGATIDADAGTSGTGGHVVVWSDGFTAFGGSISARGGSVSGDGGYTEVSGKGSLEFLGDVDLAASNGAPGTLLLDPLNLEIASGAPATPTGLSGGTFPYSATASTITDGEVALLLTQGNNVDLQGYHSATMDPGTVIDVSTQSGASGKSLEIESHGTIVLQGTIKTNDGDVIVTTDGADPSATPTITLASGSSISTGLGNSLGNITLSTVGTQSTPGSIILGGTLTGSTVGLTSSGDITGPGLTTASEVDLSATSVTIGSSGDGAACRTAGTGILNASSANGVYVANQNGGLFLGLTQATATAAGAAVSVTTDGSINFSGPVQTNAGNITLSAGSTGILEMGGIGSAP